MTIERKFWTRVWLAAGLLWFLLGIAWAPNNKLYQQGLVALVWVPGLIVLWFEKDLLRDIWNTHRIECYALLGLLFWAAASLLWSETLEPIRQLKRLLYIVLFLLSLQLLTRVRVNLATLLQLAGVGLGLAALLSIGVFYVLEGQPWFARLQGIGEAGHPILGGYVMGAAAVWLLHLLPRQQWLRLISVFAVGSLVAFVALTQSRGAFVALAVSIALMPLWRPGRLAFGAALVIFLTIVVGFVFFEPIITSRGTSYRPEIFMSSLYQIVDNPWGLGLGKNYQITIDSGLSFAHTHNLFLHVGIQLGWPALICWVVLWFGALTLAWRARHDALGQAVLALWVFSSVAMQLDAASLFSTPRPEWFITWLPVALALTLPVANVVRHPSEPW